MPSVNKAARYSPQSNTPAVESEYGRCDSCDFRIQHHPLPGTITSWFGQGEGKIADILQQVSMVLQPGQPFVRDAPCSSHYLLLLLLYRAGVQPRETADNPKKSGAFIPGIRPGEQTARYIDKVMTRLTLAGALYITFICLVPQFLMTAWNVQFYFGGTSLLIIVVVIMDFMGQVQTHMMSHQYGDVLRKANLKGYGR